jgi:hypothetical protein
MEVSMSEQTRRARPPRWSEQEARAALEELAQSGNECGQVRSEQRRLDAPVPTSTAHGRLRVAPPSAFAPDSPSFAGVNKHEELFNSLPNPWRRKLFVALC